MSVIEHDFGRANRLAERRFAKLLELDALHEANIRSNPLPYLERASERIFRLQEVLFDALQAAKQEGPSASSSEATATVTISAAEYERLKACLSIIEKGFAAYGTEDSLL
ncbi:hypothetical protein V3H18_15690 [Methylocystis sp. 9N]|uniref:Uncharacterized protein n=1 Tax=Methylocystis borbori TaxID=3118750 RepID=A0ABU7XLN2_9HYPH